MNKARKENIRYHSEYYKDNKLFESGTWLAEPDSGVIRCINLLQERNSFDALDLGCGVGRNSIPIAKAIKEKGTVTCVDLLEVAITKLKEYAAQYDAAQRIVAVQSDLADFSIPPNSYDLITAHSALEHCLSLEHYQRILEQIKTGVRNNGIVRIVSLTEQKESERASGAPLPSLVEIKLTAEESKKLLLELFEDWEILDISKEDFSEIILRDGVEINWSSTEVGIIARKPAAA